MKDDQTQRNAIGLIAVSQAAQILSSLLADKAEELRLAPTDRSTLGMLEESMTALADTISEDLGIDPSIDQ